MVSQMTNESNDRTYYKRDTAGFADDGTLCMECSVWSDDEHLLCTMNCAVDHPDYDFWIWVLEESGFTNSILNDRDIEGLKRTYAKSDFGDRSRTRRST